MILHTFESVVRISSSDGVARDYNLSLACFIDNFNTNTNDRSEFSLVELSGHPSYEVEWDATFASNSIPLQALQFDSSVTPKEDLVEQAHIITKEWFQPVLIPNLKAAEIDIPSQSTNNTFVEVCESFLVLTVGIESLLDDFSKPNGELSNDATKHMSSSVIEDIIWDEEFQRYKYVPNGMKFNPKENSLFIWVTNNPYDYRAVYYITIKGTLKLAKR